LQLNVLFNTCSIFHRNFTLLHFWVSCGSNSDAKPDFDLIWAEYSVILLFFSETMKKIHLQVFAIRLCTVCIKCFVYIQYRDFIGQSQFYFKFTPFPSELRIKFWRKARFRFDLGWIYCNSVIFLWKRLWKKYLICKFLQSGSVRIKCFVYMQYAYASAIFSALAKNHASTISILFYISCMKDWKDCDFNNVFNVLTKYQI
jgi:hypothetical protein